MTRSINALFVGGPAHGKMMSVPSDYDEVLVPEARELHFLMASETFPAEYDTETTRVRSYRRGKFAIDPDRMIWVFSEYRLPDTGDVMNALVKAANLTVHTKSNWRGW